MTETSNTQENENRVSRMIADANGAMSTARQGFSLLGGLFTAALWVGVAAVIWNFVPQQTRDNLLNKIGELIPDSWVVGLSQMTGLFGDQALNALSNMDPRSNEIEQQLQSMGVTGELKEVVQNNWEALITLSAENGGSVDNIITEGVITELFTNDAHRGLARQVIGALDSVSGNGGQIPDVIKTPLAAFINGQGFATALNSADSRALLFEALVEVVDSNEITVEKLEAAYTGLGLTAEQLRPIARTALNGADMDEALTALISDPVIAERLRTNPELVEMLAGEQAEQVGAALETQEQLSIAGFTAEQMETITNAMRGEEGVVAAVTTMYRLNEEAATRLLGNADNLAQLAELIPAGTDASNPVVALLQDAAGREALAQLVTDLAAADAQAPVAALNALTQTNEEARTRAIRQIAENDAVHTALVAFNDRLEAANIAGTEDITTGLSQLAAYSPAVIAAANSAPDSVMQAVERLQAAESNPNGLVGALMDDGLRMALLDEQGSTKPLGDLLSALGREDLAYLTQTNEVNGEEVYGRLTAVINFIHTLDAGTGGAEGSVEEIRADAANAKGINFMMAWMSEGSEITITDDAFFSSDKSFRVTTASGTSYDISAKELEAFFNRHINVADGQGREMAMGTLFNQLFADMQQAATPGSAEHDLYSYLVDNFWVDRNGDNFVGNDEGLKSVFNDASALGNMLDDNTWNIWSGRLRSYGDELTTLKNLGEAFAEELGNLAAPTAGQRTQVNGQAVN